MRVIDLRFAVAVGVISALSMPSPASGQSAGAVKNYVVNDWANPRPGTPPLVVPTTSGGSTMEAEARGQKLDGTPIPPRKPWGHPDLEAGPGGSGTWAKRVGVPGNTAWQTQPLPFTPAGLVAFNDTPNHIDPQSLCRFPGVPRIMNSANYPLQIIQSQNVIVMLWEYMHNFRVIYLDRTHPVDILPSANGHSVGRWEGDTLVIDTVGLTGDTWLDDHANIHSDALHLIEKYRRVSKNQIAYEVTYDDPKFYTKPWVASWLMNTNHPGLEIMEYHCNEFNYSLESGSLQKGPMDQSRRDGGPLGIPAGRTVGNTDPRTGQPVPPQPPAPGR